MAPRVRVPLREIVYTLSPYQMNVVAETFKNAPKTAAKFIQDVSSTCAGRMRSAGSWQLLHLGRDFRRWPMEGRTGRVCMLSSARMKNGFDSIAHALGGVCRTTMHGARHGLLPVSLILSFPSHRRPPAS